MDKIYNLLQEINNNLSLQKPVLSLNEACKYCGFSKRQMYMYTSSRRIPFYKPERKHIFFNKEELNQWLLRNRHSSMDELQIETTKCSSTKKRKWYE